MKMPAVQLRSNQQSQAMSEAPPAVGAAQVAAEWAHGALDLRNGARLIGRGGAALGALALQLPSAAAARTLQAANSCTQSYTFASPYTGGAYAIQGDCYGLGSASQRLIDYCKAVTLNGTDLQSWTRVGDWKDPALYRQAAAMAAGDASFEPCVEKQMNSNDDITAYIIIGLMVGGPIVVTLVLWGAILAGTTAKDGCQAVWRAVRREPAPTVPDGVVPALPATLELPAIRPLPPEAAFGAGGTQVLGRDGTFEDVEI